VADAIASVILQEEGGRAVGLDGSWGAGKSTVIELLRERLAQDKTADVRLWVFDAWAHEGDPLRRSFLESLIQFLGLPNESAWIDAAAWEPRVEELARRLKETEQKSTPLLSGFGALMALAVILAPVGLVLLDHALDHGMTFPGNWHPMLMGIIGWTLTLAAPVIGGGRWLFSYKLHSKGMNPTQRRRLRAATLGILSRHGEVETRTTSSETPDPTSLEFRADFEDLMRDALGDDDKRRLVIVLDNLDRVDPGSALAMWSTLQAFLQVGRETEEWRSRFWIVLPFDGQSMAKLWAGQGVERGADGTVGLLADGHSADAARAQSFMDKTFQVQFAVPYPIQSKWHEFLEEALQQAMPEHVDDESYPDTERRIVRLTAVLYGRAKRSITPREVKVLVNQIGSLHRIWQHFDAAQSAWRHSIPLTDIAYYVLLLRALRLTPSRVISRLRGRDEGTGEALTPLPEESERGLVSGNVKASLASLAYGVETRLAMQLLLEAPLLDALATGDGPALARLSEAADGFTGALADAVQQAASAWAPSEGGKLLCAVMALRAPEVADKCSPVALNVLLERIAHATDLIGKMDPLNETVESGILSLLGWKRDKLLARRLFESYVKRRKELLDTEAPTDVPNAAAKVCEMAEKLRAAGFPDLCAAPIELPVEMDTFVDLYDSLDVDTRSRNWGVGVIRPKQTPEQAAKWVKDIIANGNIRARHVWGLRLLKVWFGASSIARKHVVSAIRERYRATLNGAGLHADEITALAAAAMVVRDFDEEDLLTSLVVQGHLADHLVTANGGSHWDAVAQCLIAELIVPADVTRKLGVGQAQQSEKVLGAYAKKAPEGLARSVATLLREQEMVDGVFGLLEWNPPVRDLAMQVIRLFVEDDKRVDLLTSERLVRFWGTLDEAVDPEVLTDAVTHADGLTERIQASGFSTALHGLYSTAASVRADPQLRDWLALQLRELTAEEWLTALNGDRAPLDLGILLEEVGTSPMLGPQLRDALEKHAGLFARGAAGELPVKPWIRVVNLLTEAQRVTLGRHAYDLLKETDGTVSGAFLEAYGDLISENDALRRDPLFPTSVVEPMIPAKNRPGLRWIDNLMGAKPDLFANADRDAKATLSERIVATLPSLDEASNGHDESEFATLLRRLEVAVKTPKGKKGAASTS
jgi:hypothetical protein